MIPNSDFSHWTDTLELLKKDDYLDYLLCLFLVQTNHLDFSILLSIHTYGVMLVYNIFKNFVLETQILD